MRKKNLSVLLFALAACLLLAGCDRNAGPAGAAPDDPSPAADTDSGIDGSAFLEPADLPANGGRDIADPEDTADFRARFTEEAEAAGFGLEEAVFSGAYGTPSVEWTSYGDGWDSWFELLEGTGAGTGERTFREKMASAEASESFKAWNYANTDDSAAYLVDEADRTGIYLLDYRAADGQCAYMMICAYGGTLGPEAAEQARAFIDIAGLGDRYGDLPDAIASMGS